MLLLLRPGQNCHHFADDIFKCIFLNENVRITLTISLKFVFNVRINNIPALVQIMAWRRPGNKPLSWQMAVSLWRIYASLGLTEFNRDEIRCKSRQLNAGLGGQRLVTRSFDVFFDLRLIKRLSKQSWGWWFETPLRSLWRHCNDIFVVYAHHFSLMFHFLIRVFLKVYSLVGAVLGAMLYGLLESKIGCMLLRKSPPKKHT